MSNTINISDYSGLIVGPTAKYGSTGLEGVTGPTGPTEPIGLIGFNHNNQNNQNNQYYADVQTNKKNQQVFNQENFKKFIGFNYQKLGYSECGFCSLYFPAEMKIGDSCGHCWAFCFNSNINLKNLTYDGPHTLEEVKNFLAKTFILHPKSCTNKECIYNQINQHHKDKTLNNELSLILGFEIKNDEKKMLNITCKKRDVNIDFKLSSISI